MAKLPPDIGSLLWKPVHPRPQPRRGRPDTTAFEQALPSTVEKTAAVSPRKPSPWRWGPRTTRGPGAADGGNAHAHRRPRRASAPLRPCAPASPRHPGALGPRGPLRAAGVTAPGASGARPPPPPPVRGLPPTASQRGAGRPPPPRVTSVFRPRGPHSAARGGRAQPRGRGPATARRGPRGACSSRHLLPPGVLSHLVSNPTPLLRNSVTSCHFASF